MIIQIQDRIVELDNDINMISVYFETINKIIKERNLIFDYLIIDDQSIYDDYYNYFTANIFIIKKVEVVVNSVKLLINDTISSTDQYLLKAIPQVTVLSEAFYHQPSEKSWLDLVDLFEGIQWILETVIKIDSTSGLDQLITNYNIWNEYVQTVTGLSIIIPEIQSAMISHDNILIGDLVLYEIIPIFEKMMSSLKFLKTQGENENVS